MATTIAGPDVRFESSGSPRPPAEASPAAAIFDRGIMGICYCGTWVIGSTICAACSVEMTNYFLLAAERRQVARSVFPT